jgi:hypothetical protein
MKLKLIKALIAAALFWLAGTCALLAQNNGSIANQFYQNPTLGFSCQIPFGWVDRTQQMQGSDQNTTSRVLLAVFAHPPEATSDTINAGIVIATESAAVYSKVKTARDYFEPLAEAATAQGLKAVNNPYEFLVNGREIMRQDFSKPRGKLTMYQSSLVVLKKGQIVSFTFIGGSPDEVDELVQNLNFASATHHHH